MEKDYVAWANIFKALADENRVLILETLKNGEKCANDLLALVNVSQSTLSHHMKVMCSAGIVKSRKEGTSTYYSINHEGSKQADTILKRLTNLPDEYEKTLPEPEKKQSIIQHGGRPNGWLL